MLLFFQDTAPLSVSKLRSEEKEFRSHPEAPAWSRCVLNRQIVRSGAAGKIGLLEVPLDVVFFLHLPVEA